MALFRPRALMTLACGAIAAVAISGFAAANTVPTSKAGDGAGAISGLTISAVDYTLNAADPGLIDAVTFTTNVNPGGGATVKIKLVSAGAVWYSCTMSGTPPLNATCNTSSPAATVASADELQVVNAR